MEKEEIIITKKELTALVFWAGCAIRDAKGGSYRGVVEIVEKLRKQYKLKFPKRFFKERTEIKNV